MAFSAATLFALGADEIVMHPHSSLGPIDPQLIVFQPDTGFRHFAYEDVGAFLRFLSDDVNISEQVHISTIIDQLFSAVDPVNIGTAKRASELSSWVGERLLRLHMTDPDDKSKAKEIAENLNKSFSDHSDAVSRSRAMDLGLRVSPADKHLENLIWNVYLGIEEYMKFRHPFYPKQHYIQNQNGSQNLNSLSPLQLPDNTPQDIITLAWKTVVDQAIQNCLNVQPIKVDFSIVCSVVESVRFASEFVRSGYLTADLDQSGERNIVITDVESKWFIVNSSGSD